MSLSASASLQGLPGIATGDSPPPARWSRRVAMDIVTLLDASAVIMGSILPAWIYAKVGGLDIRWVVIVQAALINSLIHFACMQAWGMYDLTRLNDLPVKPGRLFAILVMASFAALGIGIPFTVAEIHLWVWYGAWISASFTAILMARMLSRAVLRRMTAAGCFDMRVAVFGAGEIARRVQDHLKRQKSGIHFVGVYDDRPRDRVDADGLDIKGRLDELIQAGRDGSIDQIVIALPQAADRRISMIATKLEQLPVSIHVVTHIASDLVDTGPAHKVSAIGSVGLLDVKDKPLTDWSPFIKRGLDVVVGSVLVAVTLPLMALIALAILIESGGPVLFRQRRRGLNLATFEVFKFRTMRVMEDGGQIQQAQVDDPRITAVGRVLRRTSLDELPQLFNVLRGEMSLVGPRPHALAHDDTWGEMLESYSLRHQVKPGITGLAQVEGCRGEICSKGDIEARVRKDVNYIRNWSPGLDIKILLRSLGVILYGKNAY